MNTQLLSALLATPEKKKKTPAKKVLKPKREDKSGEYLKRIDALTNIMIAQSAKSTPKRKAPVKKLTPEKRKELEAYKKKKRARSESSSSSSSSSESD